MIFWGLLIGGIAIGWGLVQIANAIDHIVSHGITFHHQPHGRIEIEYERWRDGKGWKIIAKKQR